MKFWVWPNTCREDFHKCLARQELRRATEDILGCPGCPSPRLPLGANNVPFGYLVMSSWSLPSYINLTGRFWAMCFGAGGLEVVEFLEFLGRFVLVAAGIPTSSYDYQLIVSEAAV
jgi:hypothetical protein